MAETVASSPIRLLRTIDAVRAFTRPLVAANESIAFVPTMGAFHAGHLSLMRAAALENAHVVVSIYVNPAQFGPKEDFDSYPQTWESDTAALVRLDRELADNPANLGRISALFAPSTSEMFPSGWPGQEVDSKGTFVTVTPISELLEGRSRPTFFRGITTTCTKLFNIVQPHRAYFGQKDIQQCVVIRRLVRDMIIPIQIIVCPTERHPDGLAMSSRNVYLGPRRRALAPVLYRALCAAESIYKSGCLDRQSILDAARQLIDATLRSQTDLPVDQRVIFEVDYISLADPHSLEEVDSVDTADGAIISAAIKMLPLEEAREGEDRGHAGGPSVRLLDNKILAPSNGQREQTHASSDQ